MRELKQYLDRGRFNTLAQARRLSGDIANIAKRSPFASAWAEHIKRLEKGTDNETYQTLTQARDSIFSALVAFGVPAHELLKAGWHKPLNLQEALLSKPGKLAPGECEAFLVAPMGNATTPSNTAPSALSRPVLDTQTEEVAAQQRENEAHRARQIAERKAHFEQNWGAGRAARDKATLEAYLATPPGSNERAEFFAKNQSVIWRASMRVLREPTRSRH